jgi:hypothetical protein
MTTNTPRDGSEISVGLFLRAKKQVRSWRLGRSKKKFISLPETHAERPWAGLAEWLRTAHSLLDDKTVELARNPD